MVLNCKTDKTPWTNMEDRTFEACSAYYDGQQTSLFTARKLVWFRKFKSSGMTCCVNGWAVNSILKALWLFETLQITCPTQCHISEYLSLQQHCCSNLTSGLAGDPMAQINISNSYKMLSRW